MPWREVSVMEQRREFVRLAMQEGANRRELCRRFGIHPDTGYKWLSRWQADQDLADRSRYALCLQACADQRGDTVRSRLELTFRRYGLPEAFFVDNGTPWGDPSGERWTRFSVWLLKLGINVVHSRPYHPQSRGKNERFHRTLKAEVFALRSFRDLAETQRAFDAWREVYNYERPHEALGQQVPASRYRPSLRPMPDRLPAPEYDSHEIVRTVSATTAYVSFKGRL